MARVELIRGNGDHQMRLDLQAAGATLQRAGLLRDRAPSTRSVTKGFVDWATLQGQIGQPFDNTNIPLSKLEQMRRDPMIAFGLMFKKVPLIRAPWYIKSADARVAAGVDGALRPIYGRLMLQFANDMDFGYAAIVKEFELGKLETTYLDPQDPQNPEKPVWDSDVDMLLWRPFKVLDPRKSWPAWNSKGEFYGIHWTKPQEGFVFNTGDSKRPDVPLSLSLWSTNEKDSVFGNLYGYPTTGYAYRYWWSYWYRWALADRAFERFADPAIVVYHPPDGIDDETGDEVVYSDKALTAGEDVRSGSTVAVPNSIIRDLEDRNTGQREWEIRQMEGTAAFDAMNTSFEYMDALKLRSMMVPEQALIEGKGGTSSRNVAATNVDTLHESLAVKKAEIDAQINRFLIPQWVEANFGPDAAKAEIVTRGFDEQDVETMRSIVTMFANTRPDDIPVDLRAIAERLGLPTISVAETQRRLQEAQRIAQEQLPPPTEGDQEQAGVTPEGLYYQPREVIHLANFPGSKHYTDPDVRNAGDELRQLWLDELSWLYEDFAKFVEKRNTLGLADETKGDAAKAARNIVNRWRPSMKRLKLMAEKSGVAIREVMGLAAQRELNTFSLRGDQWSMDNPDVRQWMADRGAFLVKRVTDTVKSELREFLARELRQVQDPIGIAGKVRAHFSEFPGWKADRIARTEVRDAYNAATLLSYRSAGVNLVQAYDAGGGITGHTDPECIARNGQVFTIDDAMREEEHPNGTLGWRPVMSTNFSIETVPQVELPLENSLAWWDAGTETLYLAEGLDPAERREQLLAIGERLSRKEAS